MDKCVVLCVGSFVSIIYGGLSDSSPALVRGPKFRTEPPSRVEFSNTAGSELLCEADAYPTPKTFWQMKDGAHAVDVPGLRYQRSSGESSTLVFPPFSRSDYRQPVHDAVYQCVATNEFGTVLGKEIHVRGVIKQRFSPQVYDEFVTRGNTAVLRCHLPSFAKEYVTVDSWIRSDGQVIKTSVETLKGKNYLELDSGELLVHEVRDKDTSYSYRCQTRHKLTGEMVKSESSGKIIVSDPHVSTLPRITFSRSLIKAEEGSTVRMPCIAEGNPPPTYRWMKDVSGSLRPVEIKNRILMTRGILEFKRISKADDGIYQCIARNSIGEKRTETNLIVTAPLHVQLKPQRLELNVGHEATFSCNVTGYPVHRVSWIKDKRPLVNSGNSRLSFLSRDVLHITAVRREDKGMYQCFAHNDLDTSQDSTQLIIADAPPSLVTVFPESTLYPGEQLSMKCVAIGNPIPRISWFLDSETIYENGRVTSQNEVSEVNGHVTGYLNVSDIRTDDGGEYECQATNEVGSLSHFSRVNVHGPPFVRRIQNATAISGSELHLRCPYGGYPIKRIRWLKGEQLLPLDPRQKISRTGALHVQKIERESDEGHYTCEVKNAAGESAKGSTYVAVVVAPDINTVLLPESITMDKGSRTKLVCVVIHGDTPLRFHWLKDSKPFLAHGDATVHTYEDSSIITLKAVTSSDSGHYTCVSTNAAATVNRTVHLVVNVPPQWIVQPSNASVILGRSVWMDCAAVGFPSPTILWKKLIYSAESNTGDFTWVQSSLRAHRFNNGTLTLSEVDEEDGGSYLCQAQNGIGSGLSKIITLKVFVPPRIFESYRSVVAVENNNITISCTITGDPPILVSWQKNVTNLSDNIRYLIRTTSEGKETISELHIVNTSRVEDTGKYICIARSDYGEDKGDRLVKIQSRPVTPSNVTVSNVTSRSMTLHWVIPHDGNSHITLSVVQYKSETNTSWTSGQASELIVSGPDTSATLRSLTPMTTYSVRIVAENIIGRSGPSDAITVTTLEEAPTEPPQHVQVHSTGAQSMKVTWKVHSEAGRNGRIRGFYVGYRTSSSSESFNFQKVETTEQLDQYSTYITGLIPFTQYDIVVKAFNSAGIGPKSPKVTQKTLETAPPTSPILQVTTSTSSTITVRWDKEPREKSAITEYTMHYKADGENDWKQERLSGAEDEFVLKGLRCGTRYSVYVTASNSLGTGEPSLPVTAQTKGNAPRSTNLDIFLSANSTFVVLQLNQWQSMGCAIEYFSVKFRPKQQTRWTTYAEKIPGSESKMILKHLSPGKEYVVLVTAYSEAGATQGEYHFKTKMEKSKSFPAFGKQETDQPFYRNISLVVPVVVSSVVLLILTFTIAVCFRKRSSNRRQGRDCSSQKPCNDSFVMSDIGKDGVAVKVSSKSHYSIPGKTQEYSEPYSYNNSPRRTGSDGGLFATIKRGPTRPVYTPNSYKQGSDIQCRSEQINQSAGETSTENWNVNNRKMPG